MLNDSTFFVFSLQFMCLYDIVKVSKWMNMVGRGVIK